MNDNAPLQTPTVADCVNAAINPPRALKTRECRTCSGPHDEEMHAATIRVHRWFRERVKRNFAEIDLLTPAA